MRPARVALVILGLWAVAPTLLGGRPSNERVDKQVEDITAAPDYDWLRAKPGQAAQGGKLADGASDGRARPGRDPGCGFQPEARDPLAAKESDDGAADCGGNPTGSARQPSNSGCCNATPGACACSRSLGKCDCGPIGLGQCGCGTIGASAGWLGYVLSGLALASVVFFVVWVLVRRDTKQREAPALEENTRPEDFRLSAIPETPFSRMMSLAVQAAERGDYQRAVGFCYLAGIGALHRRGHIDLRISTTNLELVETTRRSEGPHQQTARLVRLFEDIVFGDRPATAEDWGEAKCLVEEHLAPTS